MAIAISAVDLTFKTEKATSYQEMCDAMSKAAAGSLSGILGYTSDAVVSTDFQSDPHSCIFDAGAGIALNENFFKVVGWYDNEWGYSQRVIDLMVSMAQKDGLL
jgi:glyceraldehyde 3-phosphate dehydrogenase